MAAGTYRQRVLVLRKTKLGESDLILTLLSDSGCQLKAVAKGARKPTSSFASRLELFSCSDVLLVRGKSLDIVKEAKLLASHDRVRTDMIRSSSAAVVAELLAKTTEVGLDNPRVFDMALAFLDLLSDPSLQEDGAILLALACTVKIIAQLGFRPCLDACVECGSEALGLSANGTSLMSYEAGGTVCPSCGASVAVTRVSDVCLSWLEALLAMRFARVSQCSVDDATLRECLVVTGTWARIQMGVRMNSLEMLLGLLAPAVR